MILVDVLMLIKECCKNQYALGMYQGYNQYMEANFIYRQLEIYGIDFQTANSQQFLNVAISQRMIIKFHVKFKRNFLPINPFQNFDSFLFN